MKWVILFSLISVVGQGAKRSDAFLVDIFDRKVTVVAPDKHSNGLHAIFSNQTLSKIISKVQTDTGEVLDYFTLEPKENYSVQIGNIKGKKIYFIPMAPAFQEAELIVGGKSYEIPPEK